VPPRLLDTLHCPSPNKKEIEMARSLENPMCNDEPLSRGYVDNLFEELNLQFAKFTGEEVLVRIKESKQVKRKLFLVRTRAPIPEYKIIKTINTVDYEVGNTLPHNTVTMLCDNRTIDIEIFADVKTFSNPLLTGIL
jgi:hypothetical protein